MTPRRAIAWPAVRAVASLVWRRQWTALLVLGLAFGLLGGAVVAGAALTRRTATAPDRLTEAVRPGDATVQVFGGAVDPEDVAALPGVAEARVDALLIGQLVGPGVTYLSVQAATEPSDLLQPVVLAGRAPDPARADEVLVTEAAAAVLGYEPGARVGVALLTPEEVDQFDTGFGAPDGPTLELTVTGIARVTPGSLDRVPLLGTPALAEAHRALAAGWTVHVDLAGGDVDAFRAAAEGLGGAPSGDLPPVAVADPLAGIDSLRRSARVVLGGMLAALVAAAAATVLAAAQAFARQHGQTAADQQVERALGMTAGERALARLLPALAAVAVAVVVAAAVALVAGGMEPPGATGRAEPDPGWRLDALVVTLGAVGVGAVLAGTALASAWRAGRPAAGPARRRSRVPRGVPGRGAWPFAGVAFASPGGRRQRVPVRLARAGVVLGVAGLAATLAVAASLDRLVTTPARYGGIADLRVLDVDDEDIAALESDARIATVVDGYSGTVRLADRMIEAHAPAGDGTAWTITAGRLPEAPGEVVLGTRLADRLDARPGSRVAVGGREVTVVGTGLGPVQNDEALGDGILLAPELLREATTAGVFRDAHLILAPGVDAAAVQADLGRSMELMARTLPAEVQDVADLGSLPELLGAFLAALAVLGLAHAGVVTASARRADVAVLRALGAEPAAAARSVVAASVWTVAVGLAVGLPLGLGVARLVWRQLADGMGVRGDLAVPAALPAVVLGALAVAVVVSLVPARRAVRTPPAVALRTE